MTALVRAASAAAQERLDAALGRVGARPGARARVAGRPRRRAAGARPRDVTRDRPLRRRRRPSTARSTRRARSTSRARGGCSPPPPSCRGSSASCTSRPPTSPAHHAGRFGEDDLDVGPGASATPTSSPSSRPSSSSARSGLPVVVVRPSIVVGDSRTRLDELVQRPLRAAAAFARGLVDARAGRPGRDRRRRAGRPRRRRDRGGARRAGCTDDTLHAVAGERRYDGG